MNKETIVIEGIRYYADRPRSCRGCYFWKNRKVGCTLKKENCYYLSESHSDNTDNKKTDMNHTDLSFLPGRESKRSDDYVQYESYFRSELEIPMADGRIPCAVAVMSKA